MATLSRPVGLTAKAVNLTADVIKVQKLLNGIPPDLGGPKVKLVVNGVADAKTTDAIQAFQRVMLDPSLADGRVDPDGLTLKLLNENSAENVTVLGVTATGATRTSAVGNQNVAHFVTPRAAGKTITLRATISPAHALARAAISWEGAKVNPADPLEATLLAFPERKQVVRIKKADGTVLQEIRVWVVWCTITGSSDDPKHRVKESRAEGGRGLELTAPWTFLHWIHPPEIVVDPDRPNLEGAKSTPVPQKHESMKGESLAGGATLIWDASRQIRVKMLDPKRLLPSLREQLDYPDDDTEGNDDVNVRDEDNNPYNNPHGKRLEKGVWVVFDLRKRLVSKDSPSLIVRHAMGTNRDTIERRLHFREFTRIDLGGAWHRVSDFFEWRFHVRFLRVGDKWQNDGSTTEADNDGFDSI